MRGLTPEERACLEGWGSVDYETGCELVRRGLIQHVDVEGVEDCNPCVTTAEGRRVLRLDMLARVFA